MKGGGGIAVLGKKDVIGRMSLLFVSEEFERCWFLLHTDEGPILFCCWYRPPGEAIAGIRSFADELCKFRSQAVAVMVIGDLNVHNTQWLKYSLGNTPEGRELQDIAVKEGLRQIVKTPTRYENLLDLVITDLPSKATVGGTNRDHGYILIEMAFAVPRTKLLTRTVWNYKNAD